MVNQSAQGKKGVSRSTASISGSSLQQAWSWIHILDFCDQFLSGDFVKQTVGLAS